MNVVKKFFVALRKGTLSYKLFKLQNRYCRFYKIDDPDIRAIQSSRMAFEKLKKKYSYVLEKEIPVMERVKSSAIWVCWFQGIENAPLLCQTCVKRIQDVYGKKNVCVITKDNFRDYADLPDYIVDKWEQGIITNAQFSDILRIALLCEHGGTWIDATILILEKDIPSYLYDSELFVFADHISGICPNIQSSYMSAYKGSRLLNCTRELMYEYWKNENYLLDYSLFHLFFQMAEERYPEEWDKVYKYPNHATHILRKSIFEPFDERRYGQIKDVSVIQKLTYKKEVPENIEGTFYDRLIVHGEAFFKGE